MVVLFIAKINIMKVIYFDLYSLLFFINMLEVNHKFKLTSIDCSTVSSDVSYPLLLACLLLCIV